MTVVRGYGFLNMKIKRAGHGRVTKAARYRISKM
jgi:hypothetical protein